MTSQHAPRQPLKKAVMHGVTWMFFANVVAKLIGVGTLVVTGLLLTKQDFALYAVAIAWGEILSYLKCGGLQRILIHRGRSFRLLFPYILVLSGAINLLWFALLLGAAPVIASAYNTPEIKALIFVIAISIPIMTITGLLEAKLLIDLEFRVLSAKNVYAALIRNCGIIVLAVWGFGPMSFAIPLVLMTVFEATYLYRKAGVRFRPKWPRMRIIRPLAHQSGWIMCAALATALTVNGDYMVIGLLESAEILGIYFFGYQLTLAIFTMLTRSMGAVLMPSFASINQDRQRQEIAFLRALEASALVIFFVSFAMAAVAEPVVKLVWSGKWDAAIPVVQILGITALQRVAMPLCRSLLDARGDWRIVATIIWADATGLIIAAATGAALGGLLSIAIAVGIYNVVFALAYLWVAWLRTDRSMRDILAAVLGPYGIAGLALLASWGTSLSVPDTLHLAIKALLLGCIYVVAFGLLAWLLKRDLVHGAIANLRRAAANRNKGR